MNVWILFHYTWCLKWRPQSRYKWNHYFPTSLIYLYRFIIFNLIIEAFSWVYITNNMDTIVIFLSSDKIPSKINLQEEAFVPAHGFNGVLFSRFLDLEWDRPWLWDMWKGKVAYSMAIRKEERDKGLESRSVPFEKTSSDKLPICRAHFPTMPSNYEPTN